MAVKMVKKMSKKQKAKLDPVGFLESLGLYSKFAMLDALAQTQGFDEGTVTLTTNSVDNGATIILVLADYEHTVESYLENGGLTAEALSESKESIGQFLKDIAYTLGAVETSPSKVFMKATKQLASDNGLNVEDGVVFSEAVQGGMTTIQAMKEDPELGAMDLIKAEKQYQPVFGTSSGSRYHYVMGDGTFKLAARYSNKSNSLSLKVIPDPSTEVKVCYDFFVNNFGMSVKDAGHCSGHLSCSEAIAQQTLYALIAAFNPSTMKFGVPSLKEFKEYGA